ncbi:MAG TPA: aminotransferase class V-fold PLP-dependent enzyme [Steroidobacteraceae bacterium]|nr:aminotransferase class V-fold PLP-dependent enzyme [Steroidobacteraceae bacterium]
MTLSARVRAALTRGDWCHREPEFAKLMQEINARLAAVYPSLAGFSAATIAASGTGAVEAMLATFAPADSTTLVAANGVYGERAAKMLAAHGRPHRLLQHDWTAPVDVVALDAAFDSDHSITHLAVVHHETTTGRLNDLDAIGEVCRRRGVTLLLDAVSSFGAERIEAGAWSLGALAGTANKCLHGAPGLSFVLASDELWRREPAPAPGVYLDLRPYHAGQHGDGYSPFTLPVQVAFALAEALAEHAEQGGASARHALFCARAERIAEALLGAGARTLLDPADYSSVLWSWRLPEGRTYAALHDALKAEGYVIYAGQGRFGPEIFRIAHMGDITRAQLDGLCAALTRIVGGAS